MSAVSGDSGGIHRDRSFLSRTLTGMMVAAGAVAGIGALATAVAALARRFRREWTCAWDGRQLRLVVSQNRKTLLLDGVAVAAKTTLSGCGASLSWTTADRDGAPVVLTAVIDYPGHGEAVGRIYANGRYIGGAPRLGHSQPGGSPAALQPTPTDARWAAASVLLRDLRSAPDPRQTEAAERIEAGLRDVLGKMDRLAGAREAHRALGGDDRGLDITRQRLDTEANELVSALRDFHLFALSGQSAPSLDRVDDLLARVAADAELDALRTRRGAVSARPT